MAKPDVKVEFGFDLTYSANPPFFTLDSATKGRLDNTQYTLGGVLFYDVTQYLAAYSIDRGRQPIEQVFQPGQAEVQLNNHNRYFDPLYVDSPYFGNIVPQRELRISANGESLFLFGS